VRGAGRIFQTEISIKKDTRHGKRGVFSPIVMKKRDASCYDGLCLT
jgi:hypothetical protein